MTLTHPSAMYAAALSHFGASIHTSLTTTPSAAPPHTDTSTIVASGSSMTSSANGVVVAAMNTKIIEWSARFIHCWARGGQVMRW